MIERVDLVASHYACIAHAKNLIASARAVLAIGQPHIAYHLAVIALEELGRGELIGVQSIAAERPDANNKWDKHIQSHVQKLFWCFLGPSFYQQELTQEALESMTKFAQELHSKRLQALYVDKASETLNIPSEVISQDECERIISLAEARLGIAESEKPRTEPIAEEDKATQRWFLDTSSQPDKSKVFFSKASLNKLHELKNAKKWICWLKSEFDRTEAENLALAQAELARSENLPTKSTKDKWRIRFRIFSASHSIRPKALTEWNEKVKWIKLTPVAQQKNQLIVELILGDNIPIEGLWNFAWGVARQFFAALNIGTMGFWWWRMPEQIDKYYERIDDLENGHQLELKRNPSLKIDWGANRVLTAEDLALVSQCLIALPGPGNVERHTPYNYYIGGITFLSLNDIHWQCEINIFRNFFECLRSLMKESGEWNGKAEFIGTFANFVHERIPQPDEDYARLLRIASAIDGKNTEGVEVTLRDASFMKLFCDGYILTKIRPQAIERVSKNNLSTSEKEN